MNECVNVTQQIWCSLFDREKDLMNSEQRVQWYARLNKIDSKQRQTNIDAAHCLWWPRTRVNLKCMKLYSSLRGIRALNTASWKLYSWMIYKLTSGSDSFRLHQLWTRMAYVFTLVLINSNNCRCGTSKIQNNNQNNGCQFETYDWIVFHPKIIRYCDRIFYNHLSIREFEKKKLTYFPFRSLNRYVFGTEQQPLWFFSTFQYHVLALLHSDCLRIDVYTDFVHSKTAAAWIGTFHT